MKRVARNYNSLVIEALGARPIAFNPMLATAADSALAGLFLSQLLFWWGKGARKGWIYKTSREVQEETHLTRSEQDRAIRIWKQLGVIEVQLIGLPRKRHFHVYEDKLIKLLERTTGHTLSLPTANQYAKSSKLDWPFEQATTESTSENTNTNSLLQSAASMPKDIEAGRRNLAKKLSVPDDYHG